MEHSEGSPRGKFIAIQAYLQRTENFQVNDLTLHLEKVEEQRTKPQESKKK